MNTQNFIEELRNLIANGHVLITLQRLRILLKNSPILDEVILQSFRFQDLRKKIRTGKLSDPDAASSQNQIVDAILELLRAIEDQQQALEIHEEWEIAVSKAVRGELPVPDITAFHETTWVGREEEIKSLAAAVRGSCRISIILGLTGIGKTALAERSLLEILNSEVGGSEFAMARVNFDHQTRKEFLSVAYQWLDAWKVDRNERTDPAFLLDLVITHLEQNRVIILLDSVEYILAEDEEHEQRRFADPVWNTFFHSILNAAHFASRIILTSQDLPEVVAEPKNRNLVFRQILSGLSQEEQTGFFKKAGFDATVKTAWNILSRIAQVYNGHPLVLQVIVGEIQNAPYQGNVEAYWQDVQPFIEKAEQDLQRAESDAATQLKKTDEWQLHQLTRSFRNQVNLQRLAITFDRLKTQSNDAYMMMCAASVFLRPAQKEAWYMQLEELVEIREHIACSPSRAQWALEALKNRFLVVIALNHDNKQVFSQHNLVKSLALERRKLLLEELTKG